MSGGREQRQAKADSAGGSGTKPDRYSPVVTLTIKAGRVTPEQRQAWRRLWARLIAEAKQREGEQ
ncbi:MAG TPA: hypothetical protein VMU02_07240 [bacterium]|nr:hypothetical protein [bacterium]